MNLDWKTAGDTVTEFMKSSAFVRALRGPVGAGKSVACCIEVFRRACAQEPNADGIRKTRFAVVRNTNPQLKTTTIKTWRDWFDDSWGRFIWSPPYTHNIKVTLPDKTRVESEVIFLALDKPEDIKRLLSLELTGVWINEAREIAKSIVDACTMRVGRYPSQRDGGHTWAGVIMDTNAPDEQHWWAIMSGDVPAPDWMTDEEKLLMIKPDDWEFFTQPPAMKEVIDAHGSLTGYEANPGRENQRGVTDEYYRKIIAGKGRPWIKVYVLNQYQSLSDGKPVYPTFRADAHVANSPIELSPHADVYVGIDFGRTPAAVVCQTLSSGRWVITHEIVAHDMGATRFAELLKREMARMGIVENQTVRYFGDPAGNAQSQADDKTPFMVMRAAGIPVVPAPSNDPGLRIEAVETCLNRMVDGQPCLLLSPTCITLKAGFEGGYQYRRMQVSGAEKYEERPEKNRFSHPHDALQYALLGGGEGRRALTGKNKPAKVNYAAQGRWDPFNRKKAASRAKFRF